MPNTLAPLLSDRLRQLLGARGLPRALAVRRAVAICLVLLAAVLAFRPSGAAAEPVKRVLVAARDLRPGSELRAGDLLLRALPVEALPAGAFTHRSAVTGQVLVSAARAGEPITDVRLVGQANTALTASGPDTVSVGVRLADPGVADLLRPGAHVDVVGGAVAESWQPGQPQDAELLASNATVITVRDVQTDDGRSAPIVVLALQRDLATRVAALSLRQPVTVTLRQS